MLDRGLPKGEFDFVEEISRELPIRVLARIMGVPDEDLPLCVELGDAMIAQADPEYSRAVIDKEDTSEYRLLPFRSPAAVELMAYGHRLAEARGRSPGTTWSPSSPRRRSMASGCPRASSTTSSAC